MLITMLAGIPIRVRYSVLVCRSIRLGIGNSVSSDWRLVLEEVSVADKLSGTTDNDVDCIVVSGNVFNLY